MEICKVTLKCYAVAMSCKTYAHAVSAMKYMELALKSIYKFGICKGSAWMKGATPYLLRIKVLHRDLMLSVEY